MDINFFTVLHVFVTLPVGGAEQLLASMVSNFDSNIKSIICCICDKGEIGEKLEKDGHQIITLNKLHKNGWDGSIVDDLCYLIKKHNVSLIHGQLYHANLYSRFAAKREDIPAIISIHNTYSKQKKIHRRLVNRYLLKYTDAIIVGSEDIKKDVVKYDSAPEKLIHIIPNSINLSLIETALNRDGARKNIGLHEGDFVLGTIGRLEEQKGQAFLISALDILRQKNFYLKLIIVGDGRLRNQLEEQVKELSLESQVIFLGTRTDLGDIFPAINVFVMPSLWEGLSLAMLTAMAAGLAVIATDVGGVKDILEENSCGIVVKPKDVKGLANAVIKLIEDQKLLLGYASKGKEVVCSNYSDQSMVSKIQRLYTEVISSG
mgnify:FL=1